MENNIITSIPTALIAIYCIFSLLFSGKAYNYFAELANQKIESNELNLNSTPKKYSFFITVVIISMVIGLIFPIVFIFGLIPIKDKNDNEDNEDNNDNDEDDNTNIPNDFGNNPNYAL